MTLPTDAAIAQAVDTALMNFPPSERWSVVYRYIKNFAAGYDGVEAEVGGTDQKPDEICECGFARGSFGCDDSHRILAEITTPTERVQIPAGSEHEAAALEIGRKAWADVPDAAEWQRDIRGTEPKAVETYTPPNGKVACPPEEMTMTIFAAVELRWYPEGQSGPSECDLMRAMMELVNLYKADTSPPGNFDEVTENTNAEISRAVDWLHSKYGSPRK